MGRSGGGAAAGPLGPGWGSSLPGDPPLLGLLRSASARFALLFTAIFAAAGAAFALVLWWGTAGALDRQSESAVRADAMALAERWRDSGVAGTVEAIEERLATDVANETLYLLATPDGAVIAGNIERWPEEANGDQAWIRLPLVRDGAVSEARLYRQQMPGGYRLLVGRDVAEKLQLRALLSEGIAWASLAAAAFALLGAWLLRRALERRLTPATATAVAIAAGDLSHRVPLTERRDEFDRLGATMNAMLDRIERLMEGVRGVSDAIAHDLRTPIARARAKLEEALAGPDDEASLRAALEQGIDDLDAISRVFQAVLRIAEVEAGARRAAFAPLDLAPLLADAVELYGAAAEARGQQLETELPESLEMVGDRDLLLQAVANLLDNAVKFTPPGGRIRLWARQDGTVVEVGVADDGPGLSPDDRARAHERFFRADTARATPGSGLGLALVQAVAQLHGGELALRDAEPERQPPGLAAVLRLPVSFGA